jgi:hypothetical protein
VLLVWIGEVMWMGEAPEVLIEGVTRKRMFDPELGDFCDFVYIGRFRQYSRWQSTVTGFIQVGEPIQPYKEPLRERERWEKKPG